MKTKLLQILTLIVLMQFTSLRLTAQKTRTLCWITFKNTDNERKGELISLTDTSVCVHFLMNENQPDFSPVMPVAMIKQIRCDIEKKTGKTHVGAGILIGMGTGLIAGTVIGSAGTAPYTPGTGAINTFSNAFTGIGNAVYEASSILLGTLIGGVGGGVIGGISHGWVIISEDNLQIDGNVKTYQQNIEKLKKYVVNKK